MKVYAILLMTLYCLAAAASDKYPVSDIPEALMEDALAVVRLDERRIEKGSASRAVVNVTYAVTILNEQGKHHGYLLEAYNKFKGIRGISGTIYDRNGKREHRILDSEIKDYSNIASYSLYEDQRIKYIRTENNSYPYTVEYKYTINMKDILIYPTWGLLPGYNVSLQKGIYYLELPEEEEISYYDLNLDLEPIIVTNDGKTSYTWEVENIPVIKDEPFIHALQDIIPMLYVSPASFKYGGLEGKMSSWKEMGAWVNDMIQDKDILSEEAEEEIRNLITPAVSDREKIEIIYKYMQDRVRYVNISIGIGGLEPIDAQRVHEVGYGDCKALSNYMKSMLKVAGIEAVYTLVRAGSDAAEVIQDFPSQQFNHVILMVPLDKDSVWLECTSQRLPAGYLGSFTDDRTVLFIKEEGGEIGRTPKFTSKDNFINTVATVNIDSDLSAEIQRTRTYGGVYFNEIYSTILNQDEEEQKRSIQSALRLSDFVLEDFSFEENLLMPPKMVQKIRVSDDRHVPVSGDYLLYPMNMLSNEIFVPPRIRNRQQDVFHKRGRSTTDSIRIILPDEISIAKLPQGSEITSKFGCYSAEVRQEGQEIIFTRFIEYYEYEFPPEDYTDLHNFCRMIREADDQKLMLQYLP